MVLWAWRPEPQAREQSRPGWLQHA
jgi:hypothetical protein